MQSKAWHAMDAGAVVETLVSDAQRGLDGDEARRRLELHGPNELTQEKKAPAWKLFLAQFNNVLIVILIVATILSAVVGEYVDAGIILVIVLFCAILGFVQEYRAERALQALKGMLAPTVKVLRDGQEREVASKDIVPGDVLVLEAGDKIAADGRMVETHSLQCDEAPLTGESAPVGKDLKPLRDDAPVADRKSMVFTGTIVTYGRGKAVVTATGMHTEFGKIAKEVAAVDAEQTPLERRTQEIGRWLGAITLGICLLVVGVSVGARVVVGHLRLSVGARHDHVRHCARGGRGAGSARRHRHRRAGHRDARDGQAQCAGAQDASRRNARLHQRHLHRQDRHADQRRDDGAQAVRGRPHDRRERRRLRAHRQHRQ